MFPHIMDSSSANFVLGNLYFKRTPPRPTWRSHLMDLLSLIIKKFLSRSLNASLDCALNARKAVIGDYEQQKPILSSSLKSTPYNCYFFTTKHFFMSLGRLPDKKKSIFSGIGKIAPLHNLGNSVLFFQHVKV